MFKKATGWLHLWLGLISGIIVFIVSITGCLYVFHEEIESFFPKKSAVVQKIDIPSEGRPLLKPSEIVRRIEKDILGDSLKLTPFMIRYHKESASLVLTGEESDPERTYYSVDPYTANVLGIKKETQFGTYEIKNGVVQKENLKTFDFFEFILEGHLYLWLPHVIGNPLVTYGTLTFLILLISGIVLWWPQNKAAAKQRYWFRWKSNTKWRRKNYDLHNVNGFYMFIFLFLIGLTGVAMGLGWIKESIHWLASGGKGHQHETTFKSVKPVDFDTNPDKYGDPMDKVLLNELTENPTAKTYSMYYSWPTLKNSDATMLIRPYLENDVPSIRYDRYTGKKLGVEEDEQEDDLAHEIERLYLPIHEGSIGGLPTKILAFIASLISTSLPITGFYIWWGRRKKTTTDKTNSKKNISLNSLDNSIPNPKPAFKPRAR